MQESERQGYEQNGTYQIAPDDRSSFSWSQAKQMLSEWARKLVPTRNDSENSQPGSQAVDSSTSAMTNADAEFIGWQQTRNGEPYALYNVTAEQHPLYHSTVSEKTLRKHNLEIPPTPQPGEHVRRIDDEE